MPDDTLTRIPEQGMFGDTQALLNFMNSLFGTNNSSVTSSEPGGDAKELVTQFLTQLLPELDGRYSPEAAQRDSQGVVDRIMRQYREGNPSIFGASSAAGAYDSTTAKLLSNDAFARAVSQSSDTVLKTQDQYARLRQTGLNQFLNLVLGMLVANRRTATDSKNNAPSNAARNAALAAGALRGLTGSKGNQKAPAPKAPGKGNNNQGKDNESTDDGTSELQRQLDAQNGNRDDADAEANAQDVMSQILDSMGLGDLNIGELNPIDTSGLEITPMNELGDGLSDFSDLPDFDFTDSFLGGFDNLDIGELTPIDLGDTSDGGDMADIPDFGDTGGGEIPEDDSGEE